MLALLFWVSLACALMLAGYALGLALLHVNWFRVRRSLEWAPPSADSVTKEYVDGLPVRGDASMDVEG